MNLSRYLILLLLIIPLTSAVTLDQTYVLNSSVSNSSLTFSIPINVTNYTVQTTNITLSTVICSNGALSPGNIYWDTPNTNKDSAVYCDNIAGGSTQASCNTVLEAFGSYPGLIGLIGTMFLLSVAFLFIYGYSVFKSGEPINAVQVGIFVVMLIGIGLLVIIGIVAITSICDLGIIT